MRVLFIGFGSIAKKQVLVLRELIGNSLELFALRSSIQSEEVKGVVSVFKYIDVPQNIDFVVISNPTVFHYQSILKALELKIPLFIEKPVLHELKNINSLIDLFKKNNVKSYVACNLRFHKCLQYVKNTIDRGEYGMVQEVVAYCGSYLPDWQPWEDYRSFYMSDIDGGGGALLDISHEIDLVCHLVGGVSSVYGKYGNLSALECSSDDYAEFMMTHVNGAIGSVSLDLIQKNMM